MIYRRTKLAYSRSEFWRAYFDCLSRDEASGIRTTDDERTRFVSMWERGTVVWRDDGSLMRAVGLAASSVPDAVYSHPSGA